MDEIEKQVLRGYETRKMQADIAAEVGLHPSTVGRMLRRLGVEPRNRSSAARTRTVVAEFVADPRCCLPRLVRRVALSESLSLELLRAANDATDLDHNRVAELVDCCVELFETRLERQRSFELRRRSRCMYVVALGLKATVLRRSGRITEAKWWIGRALRESAGCPACEACCRQRRAAILAHGEAWVPALREIRRALRGYERLVGPGHDLDGRPIPACLAWQAEILCLSGRYDEGTAAAGQALAELSPEGPEAIRLHALSALAWCQLRMPGRLERLPYDLEPHRIEEAASNVQQIASIIDRSFEDESSVLRATTYWVSGAIDLVRGNVPAAKFKLGLALEDYQELEMQDEVVAVTADLAEIAEDPRQVQAAVAAAGSGVYLGDYLPLLRDLWYTCQAVLRGEQGVDLKGRIADLRRLAVAPG